MSGRSGSNHLHAEELRDTVAQLQARGPLLVADITAALGVGEKRARQLLQVVCLPPVVEKTPVGYRYRYGLHFDHAHLIAMHVAATVRKLPAWMLVRRAALERPTYPSGDPTHFDTDHLGRLVYRGPIGRTGGPRWQITEDDTTTPTMRCR
jgi:hypothetical protein